MLGLIVALALPVAAFAGGDSEQAASDDGATAAEVATGQYRESPLLTQLVASGELPPVDERLPVRPLVLEPLAEGDGRALRRHPFGDRARPERRFVRRRVGRRRRVPQRRVGVLRHRQPRLHPDVAESWEGSDDFTTMTVHLREGVRWSDGELLTTEDVAFWWNDVMLNESLTAKIHNYFAPNGNVMKVNIIDDYTFSFEYAEPYLAVADQMDRLTPWSPKHYMERWHVDYNEDAANEAKAEGFGEWFEAFLARQDDGWGTVYAGERPILGPFAPAKPDSVGNRLSPRNPLHWKVDSIGQQLRGDPARQPRNPGGEGDLRRVQHGRRLDEMRLEWNADRTHRMRPDGKPLILQTEIGQEGHRPGEWEFIVRYWSKIGVEVKFKQVDQALYTQHLLANDLDIGTWGAGGPPESVSHAVCPIRLVPPWHWRTCCALAGIPWYDWWESNGELGEEPPEQIQELYGILDEWRATALGTPEYVELGKQMVRINDENIWYNVVTGSPPSISHAVVVSAIDDSVMNVRDPVSDTGWWIIEMLWIDQ